MKTTSNIILAFRARTYSAYMLAMFATMWTSVAVAAATVSEQQLEIDPVLALLTCFLSSLMGGTTLAMKLNNIFNGDVIGENSLKPPVALWIFVVSHMGGSWAGGAVGFILAKANGWGPWNVLMAVIIMSFLGAKGIEMLAEKWLGGIKLNP